MKIAIICFTLNGYILAEKIRDYLEKSGDEARLYTKSVYLNEAGGIPIEDSLKDWTKQMFASQDAIIFVGAAGICVRAIAPFVQSKKHDPAIIVLDELGKHCIPLLSGHLGGANALALRLCDELGSDAVLTTATDVNGRFAVDVFAKNNALIISSMSLAKEVSASLLAGNEVGFRSEFPVKGKLPEGLNDKDENLKLGIYAGIYTDKSPFENTLYLIPEILCAGIGCKKGKSKEEIAALFDEVILKEHIDPRALCGIASIDLKKYEEGLKGFCEDKKVGFKTFTAEELIKVEGEFTSSEFVKSVTTVDNVCERSAVLLSGGKLIHKKTGKGGVTAALAVKEKEISFE